MSKKPKKKRYNLFDSDSSDEEGSGVAMITTRAIIADSEVEKFKQLKVNEEREESIEMNTFIRKKKSEEFCEETRLSKGIAITSMIGV